MKVTTKWIQNFLLSALKDCLIASPTAGQILYFDGAKWVNRAVTGLDANFSYHFIQTAQVVEIPLGQSMLTPQLRVDGTLILTGSMVMV